MSNILQEIRTKLQNNIDEQTLLTGQNFFKEKVNRYGVKVPTVTRIGKNYFKEIKTLSKNEIFELCEQLWQSGNLEESLIACHWSYAVKKQYVPQDFGIFERWIMQYVNNWASCDTLCNHTVGDFVSMYPEFIAQLKQFIHSENRWARRAAAVTLIIPARRGLFLADIFEIADHLLLDQDDLVQKGYGWMLKAASEASQKEVFDYVMQHKHHMPRTALRYAIEKMPKELKSLAMAK